MKTILILLGLVPCICFGQLQMLDKAQYKEISIISADAIAMCPGEKDSDGHYSMGHQAYIGNVKTTLGLNKIECDSVVTGNNGTMRFFHVKISAPSLPVMKGDYMIYFYKSKTADFNGNINFVIQDNDIPVGKFAELDFSDEICKVSRLTF